MHKRASVTIVPQDSLPQTPQAFQQYVEKYFDQIIFMGNKCFIAFGEHSLDESCALQKGVAPTEPPQQMSFTEGLPKGQNLCVWMHENQGKYFWEYETSWTARSLQDQ